MWRPKLRILLDTGTRDLLLFKRRLNGGLQHLRARSQDSYFNPGGQDQLAEVQIEMVRAGTLSREKQKAYVWETPEEEARDIDGLLGPAALGITVVRFDFDRHTVSLETRGNRRAFDVPSSSWVPH